MNTNVINPVFTLLQHNLTYFSVQNLLINVMNVSSLTSDFTSIPQLCQLNCIELLLMCRRKHPGALFCCVIVMYHSNQECVLNAKHLFSVIETNKRMTTKKFKLKIFIGKENFC